MNKVILMGRLTRDPDIRYSQGENPLAVARFTMAVDRRFKREGEVTADFINCVAFGKTAEVIEKYVTQGTKIAATGEWRTGSYTNKDGLKVYTNDCNVSNIEFCEGKGNNQTSGRPEPSNANSNGFMNILDTDLDELPFN